MTMVTTAQIHELIVQSLGSMHRYHDAGRGRETTRIMIAEVQAHAAAAKTLGLNTGEIAEHISQAVGAALLTCYGHELGGRLEAEFLKAFEGFGTFEHLPGNND